MIMKQSQNAITFLSAQYRAVYGRAYVKGLASAMVLTTALFGSYAAQAANSYTAYGGDSWDNSVDHSSQKDASGADYNRIEKGYYNNINIDRPNTDAGITDIKLKGELNIAAGNSAGLAGYDNIGRTIYGWDNAAGSTQTSADAVGDLNNSGLFNIGRDGQSYPNSKSSQAHFNQVNLNTGSETGLRGLTDSNQAIDDYTTLAGGYGSGGVFNVASGSITHLKNNTQFKVAQGSTGTFDGQINFIPNRNGTNSFIRGEDNYSVDESGNKIWNQNGAAANIVIGENATLNVFNNDSSIDPNQTETGTAGIYAANTNINGTISLSGKQNFVLDGDFIDTSKSAADAGHGAGNFVVSDTAKIKLAEGSHLIVGNGSYDTDNPATADVNEAEQETTLDLTKAASGALTGEGVIETRGTTLLTETVLDEFVKPSAQDYADNPADTDSAKWKEGGKFKLSDGTLEVTSADAAKGFNLKKYILRDKETPGSDIVITGTDNTIKADHFEVNSHIGFKDNLTLEADKMTLGGEQTASFNVKQLVAHDEVVFKDLTKPGAGADNRFVTGDNLIINAVGNGSGDQATTSGNAIFVGNSNNVAQDPSVEFDPTVFQVAGGDVTHTGSLAANWGAEVKIGGADGSTDEHIKSAAGHDASLTIASGSGAEFRISEGTVNIVGNGSGATSTLDISNVSRDKTAFNKTASNTTAKINIGTDGNAPVSDARMVINDRQLDKMFSLTRGIRVDAGFAPNNHNKGSNVVIGSTGTLEIKKNAAGEDTYGGQEADLATAEQVQLDVSLLRNGDQNTTENNFIYFKNGGRLEADNLQLMHESFSPTANAASHVLDIGHGTVAADKLELRHRANEQNIVVKNGTLEVGSELSSFVNANATDGPALVLGDQDTSAASGGANLNLGTVKYTANADANGLHDGTYTYSGSSSGGTINTDVVLNGKTAADATLNVNVGKWTLGDSGSITFASGDGTLGSEGHGTINIGMSQDDILDPSKPVSELTAELNIGETDMTVTEGNALNINDTGLGNFDKYTVASGATSRIDGVLNVNTADFSDAGAEITGHGRINVGGASGAGGTPVTSGSLAISKKNFDNFIGDPDGDGNNGQILFREDSTLDFSKEQAQVELGDYSLAEQDAAADPAADINLVAGKHLEIKGNDISINSALTDPSVTANVDINTTKLSLGGGNGFVSNNQALGVKSLNTHDVAFVNDKDDTGADTGNAFSLKDELNLTGQGQLLSNGTSTGNVVVAQGGKYNVKDGLYTHSGDFGLNGGQVNIDNSATNQSSLIPVSSLRVVSGDIVIDNSNAANTIKIAGTAGKQNSAALDLSQAGDLTVTRGQNLTTIDVGTEAQFTLNGSQATNLLSGAGSTDSGAGVLLSDTGEMKIKGDMTLDTSSLAAGTAAQSDKIVFNNGGTVTVNGQVTLTNNNDQAAILGQGTLDVNGGLALSGAADTNFTLAQGKVDVSANAEPALTSHTMLQGNSGQSLNIGDGTTSGDAVISFHGTDAAQDFNLAADLGLNGNGDNKVTVNFDKGNFKAQNITVSGAQNTIDLDGSAQGAVTANLTGKDLSVGESGALTVNGDSGNVTFENVTLGSGSTLALNNERFTVSGGTGDFSAGTVTGTADLTITGAQALGSLKTENFTSLLSGGADITLENGGDLNLSGDTNTDLTQFTYDDVADGTGSGDVHVIASNDPTVENSKITGKNLTISKELTSGNGLKLDVEAESLTLGSTGYDSSADTDGLGLDKLHAQNVNFVTYNDTSVDPAVSKDFTLRDQLNLRAPAADDGSAGTGTISGNVVLAGGADNALNVQEGNYTDAGNVHLNSGAITVGNTDGLSGDASLALSGNLNIDNSTGDNTITVAANAEGGDSRLDITGATLQVTSGDGTKLTTVNVGTTSSDPAVPDPETPNAHFELTGAQLDTLLNSGSVGVVLGASGEIDAQSGDVSLSTDDLVVDSGATAGKIAFNNGGTLHTDNLTLAGSGDVNIGLGTIDTNKLTVNNTTADADTATLGSGNYLVADQLDSTNANIALGNGSNLTLGDFELDPTNVDHPDTAVISGSLAANPGTISSNLVLNSGSKLNVQQGDWTLNSGSGDLSATHANIVIGAVNDAGEAYQVYDDQGSGNVVSASLAGNNLNLTESTLEVNVSGKADFNGIDTSSGSGSVLNISGDVSIANSVKLNSGDQITIAGTNGWMRFEDQAAHNLTANADGSTLNVNAGTFDNVFDLQSGGHLELELGDQTFSLAQIQELRKTLLSDADASGSVMDPGQHGYIHLGGAKVTGVGAGDGSMIPVAFDQYNPETGEFTQGTIPPIASGGTGDTGTGAGDTGSTGDTGGAESQTILALSADNRDAMDLLADIKDIRTDLLDDILLYDINTETESDVVNGNVGALMVNDSGATSPKHAEIGDATLAHAYAVSGSNGNRQFISDQETGALLGANVQSGGVFNLQNGGYIGDITLADGKAADGTNPADITTLVVQERNPDKAYASGDGGITYIASISGGANTAFINNDVTHINSGSVTVGNLQNTSELTIDSGDLTVSGGDTILASGSKLTVNGNTTLDGNNITIAGTNTFNGSLDATGNDVTVSGANTVSGDASFIADSGSVYIYGEQNISGSVTLGSSGVTDTDVSKTSTTWLYASSKLNVSGDVTTTGTVRQGTGSTITANNLNMSSGDIVNLAGNNTFTGSGSITANDLIQFAGQQSFSGDLSMDAERMYVTAGSVSANNINIGTRDNDGNSVDGSFELFAGAAVNAANDLRIDTTANKVYGAIEAGNSVFVGGKAGDSGSFNLYSGGSITAGENVYLNLSDNLINGNIKADGKLFVNGKNNNIGPTANITANDARFDGKTDFYGTGTIANTLTNVGNFTLHQGAFIQTNILDTDKGTFTINGQIITGVTNVGGSSTLSVLGHVETDKLTAADSSSVIAVGRESYTDENGNTVDSATGSLQVGTLELNGATLFVDPDYDRKVSMVAITGEANSSSADGSVKTDASGKLDGNLVVGKNSAVAWGEDLQALQADIANYQSQTGALKQGENDYGAILVVNKPMVVADGSHIIVDSAATSETLTAIAGSDATNTINTLAATNGEDLGASSDEDMVLSERSAVIVKLDNGATDSTSAFHFEKENAKVRAADGATVVLSGNYDSRKTIALFSDNDANSSGVELTGSDLNVTSKSGILKTTLSVGSDVQNITLQVDQSAVDQLPVTDDTKDIINNWQGSGNGAITGDNSYLQNSIQNDATAIDPALRLGVYGGAVQSAMAVSEQASHAMLARAGIGQNGTGSANFKNNGNVQIWANPVYAHQESDGFNAGSQSYGSDMDLYGLNAGAELSLTPNVKVGVVANVGTGSADGNGMATGVSNDFDYYGAGAYVAANMDNITVVGDVSYSKVSNDISANTSVDRLDTSLDSTNLSVGVTGKLDLNVGGTKVSPYVGLRYQRLDLDDYGVRGKQNGQIANYQNDTTELWSVPFGIAISKDYITDTGWQLRPSLDLHLKANLGDDDASGKVSWLGTNAVQNVSSEVVDPFSYGVNAGFSAKTGNFSLGAGVSYTGSENTDEVAVQANLRYDF